MRYRCNCNWNIKFDKAILKAGNEISSLEKQFLKPVPGLTLMTYLRKLWGKLPITETDFFYLSRSAVCYEMGNFFIAKFLRAKDRRSR